MQAECFSTAQEKDMQEQYAEHLQKIMHPNLLSDTSLYKLFTQKNSKLEEQIEVV